MASFIEDEVSFKFIGVVTQQMLNTAVTTRLLIRSGQENEITVQL